jgi:ketosteroid isomerase-like protein
MAKKRVEKRSTKKASRSSARKAKPARAKVARPAKRRPAAKAAATSSRRAPSDPVRTLARRIVDLTVQQDDDASFALYADNVESIEPGMPPAVGIEAIKQKFQMWRGMVSDSTWQARNVWVDGNAIIIEWAGRVTFAASGKQADFNEVAIHEVEKGKIVRERFYYDRSALQQ